MPMYDYKCKSCGAVHYELMNEPVKKLTCRKCGKTCQRVWNGRVALKFNGSGFYSTDYK